MPIYEFQCQACGTEIEILQKISDPHPTKCEACGKAEMKKKVTAAAFRLSGAGWYETDFKEGDKKKNLTETKPDSKESTKASDVNTDNNKSNTKTESSAKETSKAKKSETPVTD